MTTFDEREKGFEKKFAHDQDLKFRAEARRNNKVGTWAAEKLGLTGDDVAAYAKELRRADLEEAGDDDVVRKLVADFSAKGVGINEAEIREMMSQALAEAVQELESNKS